MRTAALRRLPGFAFEAQVRVRDEVLPRMDVAVFAGFAASGPINVPVPVEDAGQFRTIFGGDAPLAWDVALGRTVYAQLAPAVRGFFANGGRMRIGSLQVRLEPVVAPADVVVPSSTSLSPRRFRWRGQYWPTTSVRTRPCTASCYPRPAAGGTAIRSAARPR